MKNGKRYMTEGMEQSNPKKIKNAQRKGNLQILTNIWKMISSNVWKLKKKLKQSIVGESYLELNYIEGML